VSLYFPVDERPLEILGENELYFPVHKRRLEVLGKNFVKKLKKTLV